MQLHPRILVGEPPVNGRSLSIAAFFISGDLSFERFQIRQTAIQTLTLKDAQFDFGHIEPTAMLRSVMELQLPENPTCFLRRKSFIEGGWLMGVELIHRDPDEIRLRVTLVHQPAHL